MVTPVAPTAALAFLVHSRHVRRGHATHRIRRPVPTERNGEIDLLDEWKAAGTEDGDYFNNLDVILIDVPAKGAAKLFVPLLAHEVTHHLQGLGGKKITPGTLVHEFQAEYLAYRLLPTLGDADTPDSYQDLRNGSIEDIADWVRSAYAGSIKKDGSGHSLRDVDAAARQIDSWVHSYYVSLGSPS